MGKLIWHPMSVFPAIGLAVGLAIAAVALVELYHRPPPPNIRPGDFIDRGVFDSQPAQVTRLRYDGLLGEGTGWLVDCTLEGPLGTRPVQTFRADDVTAYVPPGKLGSPQDRPGWP